MCKSILSKSKKFVFVVFLISLLILNADEVSAQCQACKSIVESNIADGGSTGLGLNNGILYLLAMPYIMAISIGSIWYFKFRNKKPQLKNV